MATFGNEYMQKTCHLNKFWGWRCACLVRFVSSLSLFWNGNILLKNFFLSPFLIINLFFFWCSICQHTEQHPVLIPSGAPLPLTPNPPSSSPSTTPSSFPRVRSLSCSVSLSDISHSFFLLSPLFPFTIFYIPQMNETI